MGLPRKWKHLIELTHDDLTRPDYLIIVYGVCATRKDSCGWNGWILECVFEEVEDKKYPTATGDKLLKSDFEYICPQCGQDLFRTGADYVFTRAEDQSLVAPLPESMIKPIEWDD